MKRTWIYAGLPLAVLGSSVMAANGGMNNRMSTINNNEFSYDYVQAGYENQDWDDSLDGHFIRADILNSLDEHVFLHGGLGFFDGDVDAPLGDEIDADGWEISAGAGFHTPLQRRLDLVLTGDIVHLNADVDGESENDTGFRVSGSARHQTTDQLELRGGVFLEDIAESEAGFFAQALLNLTQQMDVGTDIKFGGDLTSIGVFARYNY